jgi:hypothetical protein
MITETELINSEIEGDVRQVLDYFRVSPAFNCRPTTTVDGGLAVEKNPDQ